MGKKELNQAKLIINPGAGKATGTTARIEQATRCLLGQGLQVDVALAKPKKEATSIAKKAVKDGYKRVIAMGGDGTIEAVLRGMVGSKARLGIIPTGTANNIAKSLGVPETLEEACALIASDNVRRIDVGQVKTKRKKLYFLELTAVGLVAALYPDSTKIPKGKLSALKDAASKLLHFEANPVVSITLDDESKIKLETMLITVVNTPMTGMNFLLSPNSSLEDGLLDICVYTGMNKAGLLAYFARVMNEHIVEDEGIQRYRARQIKIKTKPKLDVMADGIMLGKGEVRVKIIPNAIRIITPPGQTGLAMPAQPEAEALPTPVAPAVVAGD